MKKIGLIYNSARKESLAIVEKVENFLKEKNADVWCGRTGIRTSDWKSLDEKYIKNEKLDFAIVFGGDGTLLGASRNLSPKGIPIFGINTGHLGFLSEGRPVDVLDILGRLLKDEYKIEERAMLEAYIDGKGPFLALNDVVIIRAIDQKMLQLTLNVDEKPVADYLSDGLIISTPTGSTAYALAAGGAVMDPEIKAIEIVPLSAHSLTSRPHIVSDNRIITISFNRPHKNTVLQMDGQESFLMSGNEKIKVIRSKTIARFIRVHGDEGDFYSTIREKFHWGSLAG